MIRMALKINNCAIPTSGFGVPLFSFSTGTRTVWRTREDRLKPSVRHCNSCLYLEISSRQPSELSLSLPASPEGFIISVFFGPFVDEVCCLSWRRDSG